jgi:glycerophosphoryl diester phosphodiesterase
MIDVGSWFNLRYPKKAEVSFREQTVVTLAELMNAYDSFKGLFYIELKCGKKDYAALVSAVCDVIRDSPLLPQIIVKSFNLAALPVVHSLLANVQTAALFEPKVIDLVRRRSQLLTIARKYGADQLSLHYSLASPRLVSLAAAAGMPVTIWTADDPKWIERSRKRGIGAVITNDPQRLLLVRSAS